MDSMKKVYLAGNMAGYSVDYALLWREQATTFLEANGIGVTTPVDLTEAGPGEMYDHVLHAKLDPKKVVIHDLVLISKSFAVLAVLDGPSTGTGGEMIYAHEVTKIPIIVVTTDPNTKSHPWVRFCASRIVDTLEEALLYLVEIANE